MPLPSSLVNARVLGRRPGRARLRAPPRSRLLRGWAIAIAALALDGAASAGAQEAWLRAVAARDVAAIAELAGSDPDVDVNAADARGRTALMAAAAAGDAALVRRLIALGAHVHQRNRGGGTALMLAAQHGREAAAAALLDAGASVDAQGAKGWTALHVAVLKGRADTAALLLARGADPNVRDMHGWTPLMRAVAGERERTAQVLLDAVGTDVDARSDDGLSALHVAASLGRSALARALLARGADPRSRDALGRTPLEVAEAQGHGEVAALLRR